MECEEFFVPVRSFAVERLCGPSSEKDKDAAVFPAELKSQLTLKAVTADPFWKFDVSFAKRENLSKIVQKGCKPLSLPSSFCSGARTLRKRPMPCDIYSYDVAKCSRCWLTEHGDSVEVFTQLASELCDTFLKAEPSKRMRMTERLGSLLMAFEPSKHFSMSSK